MHLQPPTKEEKKIAAEILRRTDHPHYQCPTHDAAILHLFPRLDLRTVFHEDGSMSSPMDTFEAAWQVIFWLKVQEKGSRTANRFRYDRVEQLARLLGYAQTGEVIAGVEPEDVLNSRLMTPGPLCRVYGWTFRKDEEVFDAPSVDEHELMFAMMVQGGQYFDGKAWLDKAPAWEFLRRSGLENDTLALIWNLVDWRESGRLTKKEVVKMVRLISCARRGLRLHARLFETCKSQPISRHFDCLLSPIPRPAIPLPPSPTSPTSPVPTFVTPAPYLLPPSSHLPQLSRTTPSSPVLRPSDPPPPPPVLRPSSVPPPAPAVPSSPLPQHSNLPFPSSVPRASSPLPSLPGTEFISNFEVVARMGDLSPSTFPSSTLQEATNLTATGEEPTLPLTEDDIARLQTTLERIKPQDVSTSQLHQRLSGPQLQAEMHGQILDIGNATHFGPVAHAEMVNVFSQLMSELRLDIPGRRHDPLRQLRDAARVDGSHGGDVNPLSADPIASLADSGGTDTPDPMSALTQSPLPRGPPPWMLNVDHYVTPSQQEALQRSNSTAGLTQGSNLRNPSNRSVSPAPRSASFSAEVTQTSSQSVDKNHDHPPTSPELLSTKELPPPPYELEDNQPQVPPRPVWRRIQTDHPDADELYHQIQYREKTRHHDTPPSHVEASHSQYIPPQPQQSRSVFPPTPPRRPLSRNTPPVGGRPVTPQMYPATGCSSTNQ